MRNSMHAALAKALALRNQRPEIVEAGTQALIRLIPVALSDCGQSRVVGRFLLGLYNGTGFPFDLTDLRRLDQELFADCMQVLAMDYSPELEVHERVPNGDAVWRQLRTLWASEGGQS